MTGKLFLIFQNYFYNVFQKKQIFNRTANLNAKGSLPHNSKSTLNTTTFLTTIYLQDLIA